MIIESISLNPKFKELLIQLQCNQVSRQKLIALTEKRFNLSNVQATRFVSKNIYLLKKQKQITAMGEKNKRIYRIAPELIAILHENEMSKELLNEELKTKSELKLILGEIEAYQEYLQKYPQGQRVIISLLDDCHDRVTDFYGRLNAIKNIINKTKIYNQR